MLKREYKGDLCPSSSTADQLMHTRPQCQVLNFNKESVTAALVFQRPNNSRLGMLLICVFVHRFDIVNVSCSA